MGRQEAGTWQRWSAAHSGSRAADVRGALEALWQLASSHTMEKWREKALSGIDAALKAGE